MNTIAEWYKVYVKPMMPTPLIAVAMGLAFYAGLSLPVLAAILVICAPVGLAWRGFDRDRRAGGASNQLSTAKALSGSPAALISLGFAMKFWSWYTSTTTFEHFGAALLLLTTAVAIHITVKRARAHNAHFIEIRDDLLYGSSGWALVATVSVIAMIVAPAPGTVITAGVTALSSSVALFVRWPLAIGEDAAIRVSMRRARVRAAERRDQVDTTAV